MLQQQLCHFVVSCARSNEERALTCFVGGRRAPISASSADRRRGGRWGVCVGVKKASGLAAAAPKATSEKGKKFAPVQNAPEHPEQSVPAPADPVAATNPTERDRPDETRAALRERNATAWRSLSETDACCKFSGISTGNAPSSDPLPSQPVESAVDGDNGEDVTEPPVDGRATHSTESHALLGNRNLTPEPSLTSGNRLIRFMDSPSRSGDDDDDDDDDEEDDEKERDDDYYDFSYVNSRNEQCNLLDMSVCTLSQLYKNSVNTQRLCKNEMADLIPLDLLKQDKLQINARDLPWTEDDVEAMNVEALNMATNVLSELKKLKTLNSSAKKLACKHIKNAMRRYIELPQELEKAEAEQALIAEAHQRVTARNAEEKAEKDKAAAIAKLRIIAADVETSDVARGRRKRQKRLSYKP